MRKATAQSPVFLDLIEGACAQFFAVFPVDEIEVTVQLEIANRQAALLVGHAHSDLIPADSESLFIDTVPMFEIKPAFVGYKRATHEVRHIAFQTGAIGKHKVCAAQAPALTNHNIRSPVGAVKAPAQAVGQAAAFFPQVIARRALWREEVQVIQFKSAAVFIDDIVWRAPARGNCNFGNGLYRV